MKYLADTVTLAYQPELCTRCGRCVEVCPRGVFVLGPQAVEITDRDLCIECGACARNCPAAALDVQAGVGCAEAVINGMLRGGEPTCGCGGSSEASPGSCGGSSEASTCGCGGSSETSSRGCC
jgi:NAD-dependent dihydropyrimidine dehydrogenase PreA subunit